MQLEERKMKILQAVIRNYLETGEPVGSRTISKFTDLNLSSATIRNEMSDLEEMGFIIQPHTSAGRIPTDKGYRLYVDDLMMEKQKVLEEKEKEVSDMKEFLIEKVDKVEEILQNMAKLLATNTNYASLITSPQTRQNHLKFIQLTQVEPTKLLCVVVMDRNIIRNKMINVKESLNNEILLKLNILFNNNLAGLTLDEINIGIISSMAGQAGKETDLVRDILDEIARMISEPETMEIFTSGATNIFKYPELSDKDRASCLINALEEKQMLTSLIADSLRDETGTGIQVYIGDESPIESMKDCSVVTATYEIEDGVHGTIGIIGPKRMDYEKVVESLKKVKRQLDVVFKKNEED